MLITLWNAMNSNHHHPHSAAPRRARSRVGILLLSSVMFLSLLPLAHAAEALKLGGSGSCLGTMRLLAAQFQKTHPDVQITVVPSLGSGGGIHAVAAGVIDIGLSSRPLKESERNPRLTVSEYGRTPFVIVTATRNPTSSITLDQLVQIYTGTVTTWPDGKPLRLVLRPAAESDSKVLKALSPAMDTAVTQALERPGMPVALTDQDNADALEKISGAIGSSTLALIVSEQRALKALVLDGVTPSPETLASGEYPYFKTMLLVTRDDITPLAQMFIAFIRSPEGRAILTQNGHWVAK